MSPNSKSVITAIALIFTLTSIQSFAGQWNRPLPLHYCAMALEGYETDVQVSDFPNGNPADLRALSHDIHQAYEQNKLPPFYATLLKSYLDKNPDLEEVRFVISGLVAISEYINWYPTSPRPLNGRWNASYLQTHILDQIPQMSPFEFLNFAELLRKIAKELESAPSNPPLPIEALFDPHRIVTFVLQIPASATPSIVAGYIEDLGFRIGAEIPEDARHSKRHSAQGLKVFVELPLKRVENLRALLTRAHNIRTVTIADIRGNILETWQLNPWDPLDGNQN